MAKDSLDNDVNLDNSVAEQIADMQLFHLRKTALERQLSFDEIKTLEILSKVKNNEIEKREPREKDPRKAKAKELQQLASTQPLKLLTDKEVENDKTEDTISKP